MREVLEPPEDFDEVIANVTGKTKLTGSKERHYRDYRVDALNQQGFVPRQIRDGRVARAQMLQILFRIGLAIR